MRSSRAGHEVDLDPQRRSVCVAHELAVGVDVVGRLRAPERVVPDVERLFEAVHVLGDAQLGDPALARRLAVALGVRVVKTARRSCRARRGAGGRGSRSALRGNRGGAGRPCDSTSPCGSSSSATRRSSGVVTFRFSRRRLHDPDAAAGALDQPGLVGRCGQRPRRKRQRAFERRAAEDLRGLHRPQLAIARASRDDAVLARA